MSTAIGSGVRAMLYAEGRIRRLGRITGLALAVSAAASILVPAWAAPGAPAANEVVGFTAADGGGPTATWILPDGAPYLFVPDLGAEMAGRLAAVETGSGVGAILFQRPYFGTRDAGCTPEMGSDARPDLRWRGATAKFSPPAGSRDGSSAGAGNETERFASLIVYRKDIGPPPGALLLNRRLTLGTACRQAIHKTFFDRVFVPLAAPPEPARCYNLSNTYTRDGGKEIKVDFPSADRLALLQPADLDDRYRNARHRFRAILFDSAGCRGNGGEFRSNGQEPGNIKLDRIGLRDKVRSVRIVYEGGPLAPYYAAPAAAPVAKAPAAQTRTKVQTPTPDTRVVEKTTIPRPTAPKADEITDVGKKIATKSEATTGTAIAEIAPAPPSDVVLTQTAPTPAPANPVEPATVQTQTAAVGLYAALPAPRLKMPPATSPAPAPAALSQTFEYPVHEIYRLNFCLRWGLDCGEPAATAWCKSQGFAKASAWKIDKDIGSLFPTIVLADKRVCAQFPCDGFEEITCINENAAPLPVSKSTTKG
jgi:hypothetical protein